MKHKFDQKKKHELLEELDKFFKNDILDVDNENNFENKNTRFLMYEGMVLDLKL